MNEPIIIAAYEREDNFYGVVSICLRGITKLLEFGVDRHGYGALRRILKQCPVGIANHSEILPQHHFTGKTGRHWLTGRRYIVIRVTWGRSSKYQKMAVPAPLLKLLCWFAELATFEQVAHLNEITYPTYIK